MKIIAHKLNIKYFILFFLFTHSLLAQQQTNRAHGKSGEAATNSNARSTLAPNATITGNFSICLPGPNTTQLTGSGTPNATAPWTSLNPLVATVDNTGLVTAVGFGTTTITYTDSLNNVISENVYVSTFPTISSPSGSYTTCAGGALQLTGSIFPNVSTPWESQNTAIATVDNTGLVTGVSGGLVNILYRNLGGCTVLQPVTINPLLSPTITCGATTFNQITFNWGAVPGASTYTRSYKINGGAFQLGGFGVATNYTLTGLSPGDYVDFFVIPSGPVGTCFTNGTVRCFTTACTLATSPLAPTLTQIDPNCATPTGTINITGVAGETYSLDGGGYLSTLSYSGLLPGPHTVRAKNAVGCTSPLSNVTLAPQPATPLPPVSGGNITQCQISPIQTLTATATVLAGETLTWYTAATAGSVVASPTLSAPGTITYFAETQNGSCTSPTRTAVTLTINAAPAAPVSGGNITQCQISPTQTLTATANVPAGQTLTWYNAATGGATVASPTLSTVGNVTYYAEADNGCKSLSRTLVVLTINPAPAAPISSGNITQCEITPIQTLTATANVPVGQTITWYNAANAGTTVATPTLSTSGTVTYFAEASNGCASFTRTAVTLTINAAAAAPVSGGNITQCQIAPTQTLTATANVPVAQTLTWYNAATAGTTVASPTLNSTGTITYYAEAHNGCPSLTRTAVTLTINPAPTAPISGGNITQCQLSPIQTLTAAANVPVGQTLTWYNAATAGTTVASPTLNTTGTVTYYAEANNGCPSVTRTAVILTINAAPAAPISGGNISQCEIAPIQTLTAAANVPVGQTLTWYNAATAGTTVASPTLNTTGTVTYYAESNNGCPSLTRTAVTLTINSAPAAPVSGGNSTQCEITPIQTLTATANVPVGQTLSWYNAATAGTTVASPTLNTTGTVTYYAEASNGSCSSSTRTAVVLTINAAPTAPVSGGNITQCELTPIQTLTATANVAIGQTLTWYNAATAGTTVGSVTLNTTGTITYYAEANNGCPSLTRTAVTLTINAAPAAPVSGGNITQCEASPIQTLTATANVPVGQTLTWYNAATAGATVASPTLNTTGTVTYYAEASNGCPSLTRTPVTLTINSTPAGAPTSGGNITQCEMSPIQTLTATASVAAGQALIWYDAATAGTTVASPTLSIIGTVTYFAEANNGCPSPTRTPVTLTINPVPTAAPISGGNITQCELSPIQTLTATANVPGGETVIWFNLPTGGTAVASPILSATGTLIYYAEANNGTCSSLTRTAVILTINSAPAAVVSTGNITQCETSPIQTLDANNAITAIPLQTTIWYTAATAGTVVAFPTLNTAGTITYFAEANDGTCSSYSRTAVTLTINAAPAAPISTGNITECELLPIQTLDANDAITPILGITVIWYPAATGGSAVANPTLNVVGTVTYYAEANDGTCPSLTRTAVTLTIDPAPTAPVSTGNITQCEIAPIQTLDANNAIIPVPLQTITWYTAASGGTAVVFPILNTAGSVTYYAEANDGNCPSSSRTAVTLTITAPPPAPTSTGNITECELSPIQTLDAGDAITPVLGQTITWYTAALVGSVVASPTLNSVGTITYYAEANDGTCPSLTRTAVTLTINGAPIAPFSTGNITQCEIAPIQTLDANTAITAVLGQTITWYNAATAGTTVALPTLNTPGVVTYYAEANDGTCPSYIRTAVILTINAAPTASISTGNITQCELSPIQTLDANNAITLVAGQTTSWYTAATAGTGVAFPTLNAPGTITYFAEANDGTCSALTRTAVTLTINAAPAAPVSTGNITQCELSPIQTLNAATAIPSVVGQTVSWFTAATSGLSIANPLLNAPGTVTYHAESNDGTCSSLTRTAVTLTINGAPTAPSSTGNITQCELSPIQTLNANNAITPVSGQTVSWYNAATLGTLVANQTLNSPGTVIYYAESNDGTCSSLTRTAVILTINAAPAPPISTGNITECELSPIQTLNAFTAITPVVGQTVSWFTSATLGTPVASPTLNAVGTVTYYAESNDGTCPSLTRTAVVLTINGAPSRPVLNFNITQCELLPIQTLNAVSAITPIPGQNVSWFTTPTLGTPVTFPTLNSPGTITYFGESNDGTCPSYSRTAVVLTINAAPAAQTSTGNITQCEQSPIQTLTAGSAIVPISGQIINWFNAATGGAAIGSATLSAPGTVTYYAQSNDGTCPSLTRTAVTLTITAAPAAPISTGNITQCQQSPAQTLDATTAITTTPGQTITWFNSATLGTAVANPTLNAPGTITYYGQSNDGSCSSLTRTGVILTINAAPAAPFSTGNITQCELTPIQTLDARNVITPVTGQTFNWFTAATLGIAVGNPTLNTPGTITYYAETFDGTCPSLTRTAVTLTINAAPAAPISTGNITQCQISPLQTLNAINAITPVTGQTTTWFDALVGGSSVPNPRLNSIGNITYYAQANDGTCSSFTRTAVTLTINPAPAAPISGGDIFQCEQSPLQTITAVASVSAGQVITWYNAPVGGTVVSNASISTATSVIYYAQSNDGTCNSLTRTPIILTINPLPLVPTIGSVTPPDCANATGSVTIFPVQAGVTYSLDNGPFTTTAFYGSLSAGVTHTLVAKNTGNCLSAPAYVVIQPQPTTPNAPTFTIVQPSCTVPTAEITINGVPGETYAFDTDPYLSTLTHQNLSANSTHTIKAKNSFGCISAIATFTVNVQPVTPAPPTLTPIQPTCKEATGSILIAPVVGQSFSLDGGLFTNALTYNQLPANSTHNVRAINASGCISTPTPITLDAQPATPNAPSYIIAQPSCTAALGEITINAVVGESYSFDGSAYSDTLLVYGNLAAGTYTLTAQNIFGCTSAIANVVITPQPITATPAITDGVVCVDQLTGIPFQTYTLNTLLDPATHTFVWTIDNVLQSNTGSTFIASQPGIYSVVATNNSTSCNSITATANVTLSYPALGITTQVSGQFTNETGVVVTVNTGTGPFLYQLDYGPQQQSNVFNAVTPGTHTITVRDENGFGCTYLTTKFIILGYMNFFTPNNDGYNDLWNVIGLKDQPSATIHIYDRTGKYLKQISPADEGWDGTFNDQSLPSTDYWFTAEYTENGERKEFKSHFSLIR